VPQASEPPSAAVNTTIKPSDSKTWGRLDYLTVSIVTFLKTGHLSEVFRY
jgi:hypothetical protein